VKRTLQLKTENCVVCDDDSELGMEGVKIVVPTRDHGAE
jgi:hypothetical protein